MNTNGKQLRRVLVIASFLLIASSPLLILVRWNGVAIAGQLTAMWVDGSTDELGFSVERSTGTTGTFAEIGTTGTGITIYTDATVADAATYCYRVRAYSATAYSAYSNVACGTTASALSLTVVEMGTGTGAVISTPSGIICGATCSGTYASGTAVTLTASPASGSSFTGWNGGGCSATGTCTVTLTASTTVTASFALNSVGLTVSKAGAGTGTVTSTPAGISCGTTCSASYAYGTAVTLKATPATGSTFGGWSGGGCSGTGACTVALSAATTVTATFTSQTVSLAVSVSGKGTVTSTPAGINCGKSCLANYAPGTVVTLSATPGLGFKFKGWSGGTCTGTGTCTVSLTTATSASASFAKK